MNTHHTVLYRVLLTAAIVVNAPPVTALGAERYREPSDEVKRIVDAPPTPSALTSPGGRRVLLVQYEALPSIAELAEPIHRLAGTRINPRTNDRQRTSFAHEIVIRDTAGAKQIQAAFPADSRLGSPVWSHDASHFAVSKSTGSGIELWVVDAATGTTRRLIGPVLNGTLGSTFRWLPGKLALLCKLVPKNRGAEPKRNAVPLGPNVDQAFGKRSQVRTYQDLLKDTHDDALFEHFMTCALAIVDVKSGGITRLDLAPAVYSSVSVSPDNEWLLATRIRRPYSHHVPYYRFAHTIDVVELKSGKIRTVTELPVADEVPIDGVPTGPRSVHWRPLADATLVWTEALDQGDPMRTVSHRDRTLSLDAPFTDTPTELIRIEHRYSGIHWLDRPGLALITEYDRDRKWRRTQLFDLAHPSTESNLVWDMSIHDRYNDPGSPIYRTKSTGARVVRVDGHAIFLSGSGATPEGDRPFLDRFDLVSRESTRLFRCEQGSYEQFISFAGDGSDRLLTRRETKTDPPNYFIRNLSNSTSEAFTDFEDPAPWFTKGVRKELIHYERDDGIPLSATLYLPPNYKQGERLPLVVWAYPREYTDPKTAGQVRAQPSRFTWLRGTSQLFFLTQGYAVLDGAQLPIIGDPETVNNTFVQQLVGGAQAAVDAAVKRGVADPDRVGIAGHSYGAFMTANLLAHSDIFRAGIARSGAYNRTLTPFGFQNERRTFWQAPETYFKMSPFMHAHKINEPILLIHGEMDNNSGTFPVQSVRFYHALKGHGAKVRLVMLPFESHGYRARESVLHTLAEMFDWFDQHVKKRRE